MINKRVNDFVSREVEYNHVRVNMLKIPMKMEASLYTVTQAILSNYNTYPILLSYTYNTYILQVFREIVIIVYSIIYFSPISSFYRKLEMRIIIFEQYVNFRFPILAEP